MKKNYKNSILFIITIFSIFLFQSAIVFADAKDDYNAKILELSKCSSLDIFNKYYPNKNQLYKQIEEQYPEIYKAYEKQLAEEQAAQKALEKQASEEAAAKKQQAEQTKAEADFRSSDYGKKLDDVTSDVRKYAILIIMLSAIATSLLFMLSSFNPPK
jgi:hypothetical protein